MKKFRHSIGKQFYDNYTWYTPFVINKTKEYSRDAKTHATWHCTHNKQKAIKWLEKQKLKYADKTNIAFVIEVSIEDYYEL